MADEYQGLETQSTPVISEAEIARLRAIENAALRVASSARDSTLNFKVYVDKTAMDALDMALEAR